MSLRPDHLRDAPNPNYDAVDPVVTLKIHHAGKFAHYPEAVYDGGSVSSFDYFDLNFLSMAYLDELVGKLGYNGRKTYYKLDGKKWRLILFQIDLQKMINESLMITRELHIYLDAHIETADSHVGSTIPDDLEETSNESFHESEYEGDESEGDKGGGVGNEGGNINPIEGRTQDGSAGNEGDNVTPVEGRTQDGSAGNEGDNVTLVEGRSEGTGAGNEGNRAQEEGNVSGNESIEDVITSGDDFDSDKESDGEGGEKYPVFRSADILDPTFEIGMIFSTKKEFREAIHSFAIKTRRNIKITKNDNRRVYAKCGEEGCEWRIHALKLGNQSSFQIKEYYTEHRCGTKFQVKNCTSKWISKKYEDRFRTDPNRNVKGFRKDVIKEIRLNISKHQAYRAKRKALKLIEGDPSEQYAKLWDYAHELRRTNPHSTIILTTNEQGSSAGGRNFEKMYVCFNALKQGFKSGCRPFIGVDGCHLKGPNGGILLTAVSIDPNNNLYPIAYALVCGETRESWEWFLNLLREDLGIIRDDVFTFISDKQKGLIPAFQSVFPSAENRFCVRHLHGNLKTAGFRGQAFKNALWNAARASTIPEWESRMKELAEIDERAFEWLSEKPATQWSRSHFNPFPKCDMLLNNICETFNCNILEAREKPVLTMLEWIREYLMKRLQENRDRARRKWKGKLCPKIKKIVEKNLEKAADCIPMKSDDLHYEISCYDGSTFIVDLARHSCSCRKWDLTGIPCNHGMSAIACQLLNPEDFVHPCYTVQTYLSVYEHAIAPINGPELWEKTGLLPPCPPNFGRSVGKPARARRLEPDELPNKKKKGVKEQKQDTKLKRQPYHVTCHFCGRMGHNQKGCQLRKEVEEFASALDGLEGEEDDVNAPEATVPKATSMDKVANEEDGTGIEELTQSHDPPLLMIPTPQLTAPRHPSVNIRAPPPFSPDHPSITHFASCVSTQFSTSGGNVPVFVQGGQRFVSITNLSTVIPTMNEKNKSKEKK